MERSLLNVVDPDPPVEATAIDHLTAARILGRLFEVFGDDEHAFFVIYARAEGDAPEVIQRKLGLDRTTYATVLRRIRRKIDRAEKEGRLDGI